MKKEDKKEIKAKAHDSHDHGKSECCCDHGCGCC